MARKAIALDEKDHKILAILRQNSKYSTQQISKRTSIPITTVHNRLKKLEKENIITNYTVELNKKALGLDITAYVLVNLDADTLKQASFSQDQITNTLSKREEVEEISLLAGQIDMIIKINVANIDALNNFILDHLRKIEGIERTQTLIVLNEVK